MGKLIKENRMKKLLDLYEKFKKENKLWESMVDFAYLMLWTIDHWKNMNREYRYMVSKECWFIKWLFDNKKIDLEELETELSWIWIHRNIWYYEGLLMLLSIQDNPIEFLISILR